jgi:iron(III) transport system ATP-binding protein
MIRVAGITKKFTSNNRESTAVADVSIAVGDNEIVVLLGPSGSGKTTLLRCVAGLETADHGEIAIGDQIVFSSDQQKNVASEKRRIGMVFQSYAIWPHLTVADNVALPLLHGNMRVSKAAVQEKVLRALRAVKLSGYEDRPAPFLSGGQQQRVALARALAVEPKALLMDEPLSNLDARLREEVRFEIHDIAKKAGLPVLYVTHDQTEALALADRVAIMDQGRILQVDTPEAVYDRPANATVAGFLGSMNWLSGKSSRNGEIESPLGTLDVPGAAAGLPVQIGIRPESIDLSLTPAVGKNVFRGKCTAVSFLGDHKLYRIQIGTASVVVKHARSFSQNCLGSEMFVFFPEGSLLIFPVEASESQAPALSAAVAPPASEPVIREAPVAAQA